MLRQKSRDPHTASIRRQVRQRAADRCEYCLKPTKLEVSPFHIDHIIPERHTGSSALGNLAWSCLLCNIAKGTDIASIDPLTNQLTPLFNPRTQQCNEHFEKRGVSIAGTTPIGRVTASNLVTESGRAVVYSAASFGCWELVALVHFHIGTIRFSRMVNPLLSILARHLN